MLHLSLPGVFSPFLCTLHCGCFSDLHGALFVKHSLADGTVAGGVQLHLHTLQCTGPIGPSPCPPSSALLSLVLIQLLKYSPFDLKYNKCEKHPPASSNTYKPCLYGPIKIPKWRITSRLYLAKSRFK